MRHLVSAIRYSVAPITSSQLTTALNSSVKATFIFKDTKYSVPVITITKFDSTKYTPPSPKKSTITSKTHSPHRNVGNVLNAAHPSVCSFSFLHLLLEK
jgi:hypothetical protein